MRHCQRNTKNRLCHANTFELSQTQTERFRRSFIPYSLFHLYSIHYLPTALLTNVISCLIFFTYLLHRHRFWHATRDCVAPYNRHHYITLHKIVFRVPKITRTARTLYEIKGVIWERAVLSQICCFGERKVVLFQILLEWTVHVHFIFVT